MTSKFFRHFGKMTHLDDAIAEQDVRDYETDFWVSEKIDGCNIGIHFTESGVHCFSRNGNSATELFEFSNDFPVLVPLILAVQEFIRNNRTPEIESVYLWGEYYGNKINRRIDYGVDGGFKFYDGFIKFVDEDKNLSEYRLTPKFLDWFISKHLGEDLRKFFVNYTHYRANSLSELKAKLELPSKSEYCDDQKEGYVITEITEDYKVIHYKYKAPDFQSKPPKLKFSELSETKVLLFRLNEAFKKYFNEARVIEVFSKNTNLTKENIPELCRQLVEDAKDDFINDYADNLLELDDDGRKKVYNVGALPFKLIKSELEKIK